MFYRENASVSMGAEMMGWDVLCVREPVAHLENVMNEVRLYVLFADDIKEISFLGFMKIYC